MNSDTPPRNSNNSTTTTKQNTCAAMPRTCTIKPLYTAKEATLSIVGVVLTAIILMSALHFTSSSAAINSSSSTTISAKYKNSTNQRSYFQQIANGNSLSAEQVLISNWIANKYLVSTDALQPVVAHAWRIGEQEQLDPRLLLAVAAIESRFNPLAQSPVGAQGLMQVMTRVHKQRYDQFGGIHNAFDPLVNLEIGAQILRDCAKRRHSIENALNCYVGGNTNGSYPRKVLSEYQRLLKISTSAEKEMLVPLYPA